jgi:hypothetical protein
MEVLFQRVKRAGLLTRTSANRNLTPNSFASKRQDQYALLNGNPSFSFINIITIDVEPYGLGKAKTGSVTNQQDGTITLISQAEGMRSNHVKNAFGQHSFILHGRALVNALDTSQNRGNVTVNTIKGEPSLLAMRLRPKRRHSMVLTDRAGTPSSGEAQLAMKRPSSSGDGGRESEPLLRLELEKCAQSVF